MLIDVKICTLCSYIGNAILNKCALVKVLLGADFLKIVYRVAFEYFTILVLKMVVRKEFN